MFHLTTIDLLNMFTAGWCLAFMFTSIERKRWFTFWIMTFLFFLNLWCSIGDKVVVNIKNMPTIEIRQR
jgi:hypothetical protein